MCVSVKKGTRSARGSHAHTHHSSDSVAAVLGLGQWPHTTAIAFVMSTQKFHISSLHVEHFRSFGGSGGTTISFRPGFNVIVGSNGSGKSNALDATLFALAQDPQLLRVRSWQEVQNRHRAGPCAVRLVISDAENNPELVLLAHAKPDGVRVFKLNGGAQVSAQQAKDALLEVGLDASSPSFAVRQHAAAMPIDSRSLTSLLQGASGASTWAAAAAHSRQQLAKERESLTRVQGDIASLEQLLVAERAAHGALTSMLRLHAKERRGRRAMGALASCLAHVSAQRLALALAHAQDQVAAAQKAIAPLQRSASLAQSRLEAKRGELREAAARAAAGLRAREDASDAACEAEADLVHAVVLMEEAREAHARLRADASTGEHSNRERRAALARLRGTMRACQAVAAETEAEAEESEAAARSAAAATSSGWFLDKLVASSLAQAEARLRLVETALAASEAEAAEASSYASSVHAERIQRATSLDSERQRLVELTSLRMAAARHAEKAATALADARGAQRGILLSCGMETAEATPAAAEASLLHAIHITDAALDDAQRHASRAALSLPQHGSGPPSLCDVLELQVGDERLPRCLTALDVLAGRHLAVRLTNTREEALPLLEEARGRGERVRVWPLASLTNARPHSKDSALHGHLQQTVGSDDVVRPDEVVVPAVPAGRHKDRSAAASCNGDQGAERFRPALRAAFGPTLIVSSDQLASSLVREHGQRCITMAGNVHDLGSLQGGHRDDCKPSAFAAILARQQAVNEVALLSKRRLALGNLHELARGAARAAAAAEGAAAEERACDERLQALLAVQQSPDVEEEHLCAAASAEGEYDARRASSQVDGLRLSIEVLRGTGVGGAPPDANAVEEETSVASHLCRRANGHSLSAAVQSGGAGKMSRDDVLRLLGQVAARAAERAAKMRQLAEQSELAVSKLLETGQHNDLAAGLQVEMAGLEEQQREQRTAFERAEGSLRKCEIELRDADQVASTTATESARCAQAESNMRAEARRLEKELESARIAAEAAGTDAVALQRTSSEAHMLPTEAEVWVEEQDQEAATETQDREDDAVFSDGESLRGPSAAEYEDDRDEQKAAAHAASLTARLQAGALLLESWRRERQELEHAHGSVDALRNLLSTGGAHEDSSSDRQGACNALHTLEALQAKASTVSKSIEQLTMGIKAMRSRVSDANSLAVRKVSAATKAIFEAIVPSMEVGVVCDDPGQLAESGAHFRLRIKGTTGGWLDGPQELSGGQRTLLNLSLLLAIAQHRPSMVLLMDEVDAALDESNASRVASLLKELSKTVQVIAISHRPEMHRAADHIVRLTKDKGFTVVAES